MRPSKSSRQISAVCWPCEQDSTVSKDILAVVLWGGLSDFGLRKAGGTSCLQHGGAIWCQGDYASRRGEHVALPISLDTSRIAGWAFFVYVTPTITEHDGLVLPSQLRLDYTYTTGEPTGYAHRGDRILKVIDKSNTGPHRMCATPRCLIRPIRTTQLPTIPRNPEVRTEKFCSPDHPGRDIHPEHVGCPPTQAPGGRTALVARQVDHSGVKPRCR